MEYALIVDFVTFGQVCTGNILGRFCIFFPLRNFDVISYYAAQKWN